MHISQPHLSDPISFTEVAIAKVESLIAAKGNQKLKLRIYIVGGGCSGFKYGFGLDEKIAEDDIIINKDTVS
ncbi:MAG TPA: iron-sulfur cluster biosynthesis family protein, partial [Gammaproteobacteria bacterium]|nr:iron-sulfur cluster biosynthesis family protein [Gammaproteobacteria bacterium]